MFLGFDFDPSRAFLSCEEWLQSAEDIDLEHLETQRASIKTMLNNSHLLSENQRQSLQKAEVRIYEYLSANGAVSSPVLRDPALEVDLLDIPFDATSLDREIN